jgi:hypothetical protein
VPYAVVGSQGLKALTLDTGKEKCEGESLRSWTSDTEAKASRVRENSNKSLILS